MPTDIDTIKLIPEYDVLRLQDDLSTLGRDHFRRQASDRGGRVVERSTDGWDVLSLRSAAGSPARTDPGTSDLVGYLDTPLLGEAPYLASVLSDLRLPLRAVRLMSLEPGESVGEHSDGCGLPEGWVRLHLPIVTNAKAAIVMGGREHRWQPGELWYADFGGPHSVYNRGVHRRVHLVIDSFVDSTFLDLVPSEVLPHVDLSEIMFYRPEQPMLSATLDTLTGPISIPSAFLKPKTALIEELVVGLEPDLEGKLSVIDGKLFLIVGEEFKFLLVHLGDLEFRMVGRTEARSVKFDFCHDARRIRFRRRRGSDRTEVVREY
jgi:aspartate beta-hydroxylase